MNWGPWRLAKRAAGTKRSPRSRGRLTLTGLGLVGVFVVAALFGPTLATALPAPASVSPTAATTPSTLLHLYRVQLGNPDTLVAADAPIADLQVRTRQHQRDNLAAVLAGLKATGEAGPATFDDAAGTFQVDLSDTAVHQLATQPLAAKIELAGATASAVSANQSTVPPAASPFALHTQNVSSVNFIQVYSPFMWGHTSVGGLSVQIALLDSTGTITVGVPVQITMPAPNNYVQVDRTQLYYETVFVDPNNPSHPPVMIVPGEQVHVVTSGIDPSTGLQSTTTQVIAVDDVEAWTTYQNDTVTGHTSLAGAPVVVTFTSYGVSVSNYLTPGSGVTYANTSADGNGNFSVGKFQSSPTSTPSVVNMQQGTTGFVRVQHPDGNEVYTIHGQNTLVLENSNVAHGWLFSLPGSLGGLNPGVAVSHPQPTVSITLTNAQGQLLDVAPKIVGQGPYTATFNQMIVGGDIVQVSINNGPLNQVTTSPLTAAVDLSGDQVTGSGPANTSLTISAGNIDGYISSSSSFSELEKQVTSNSIGAFSSGPVQCGTNNQLVLQPGSFGYVGYEDSHGNFIYENFAAPRADIMVNYPFVEGWNANGAIQPTVTVRDSNGNLKSQANATPLLLYSGTQQLYVNTYYNLTLSQFIVPGDTVTVVSGSQTFSIPVDQLTANLNTDNNTVDGSAPVNSIVKIIPASSRTTYQTATANATSAFTASNPFSNYSDSSCTVSQSNQTFGQGSAGRVYLTHPDGNTVFAVWGRAVHINENENFVEIYMYPTDNLDWSTTPAPTTDTMTVTLAPTSGASTTMQIPISGGAQDDARVSLTNAEGQKVLIRAGDTLTATFAEGPVNGPNRTATLSLANIPLVTGTPDVASNTIAGVGPPSWAGQATLNAPPSAQPVLLPPRASTAYFPLSFLSSPNTPISLVLGYSGVVSFSDTAGHRVWSAWAVTAFPVKITGILRPGDIVVCGTAQAGIGITILDATTQPQTIPIGTGATDGQGNFCVTVSPPLFRGQVILAQDANGTLSQPAIVGLQVFLPLIPNG